MIGSTPAGALAAIACALVLASPAPGAPADPDPGFGQNGRVTTDFAAGDDSGAAIAIQPDGRIVVAGDANTGTAADPNYDFAVARYLPNGALDESFGGDGRVTTSFDNLNLSDRAADVAIQPDGKLVVVGAVSKPTLGGQFAVARYRPDGSLDPDFSVDGRQTFGFGSDLAAHDVACAVVLDGTDIVVAGWSDQGARGNEVAIARLTAGGSLDPTFGVGGRRTSGADGAGPGDDAAYDLIPQPNGGYVAVGASELAGFDVFSFYRYDHNGALDPGFGEAGIALAPFEALEPDAQARAATQQSDGKLVAAGFVGEPADFAVARYLPDGQPDPTFGVDGRRVTSLGLDIDGARGVAVDAGGRLVVAGMAGAVADTALVRYRSDGSLDPDFAGDGVLVSPFGAGPDYANAVALQPDGRIVAAGEAETGSSRDFTLLRLLGDSQSGQGGPQPVDRPAGAPLPSPGPCANVVTGTRAMDVLRGTAAGDRLLGRGGNDRLSGLAGADCLNGGPGADRLRGGAGDDSVVGGRGRDRLVGGGGRNSYSAGGGRDQINAANGRRERVDCGPGRDSVRADRGDRLIRCELVARVRRAG
jgi:uncharacterized delta-60 repeat protein